MSIMIDSLEVVFTDVTGVANTSQIAFNNQNTA